MINSFDKTFQFLQEEQQRRLNQQRPIPESDNGDVANIRELDILYERIKRVRSIKIVREAYQSHFDNLYHELYSRNEKPALSRVQNKLLSKAWDSSSSPTVLEFVLNKLNRIFRFKHSKNDVNGQILTRTRITRFREQLLMALCCLKVAK